MKWYFLKEKSYSFPVQPWQNSEMIDVFAWFSSDHDQFQFSDVLFKENHWSHFLRKKKIQSVKISYFPCWYCLIAKLQLDLLMRSIKKHKILASSDFLNPQKSYFRRKIGNLSRFQEFSYRNRVIIENEYNSKTIFGQNSLFFYSYDFHILIWWFFWVQSLDKNVICPGVPAKWLIQAVIPNDLQIKWSNSVRAD